MHKTIISKKKIKKNKKYNFSASLIKKLQNINRLKRPKRQIYSNEI